MVLLSTGPTWKVKATKTCPQSCSCDFILLGFYTKWSPLSLVSHFLLYLNFYFSFVIFSKVVGLLDIKAPEQVFSIQIEVFSIHIYNIHLFCVFCVQSSCSCLDRTYQSPRNEELSLFVCEVLKHRSSFVQLTATLFISIASLQRNLLPHDMRCNLFFLFSSWCAHFGVKAPGHEK